MAAERGAAATRLLARLALGLFLLMLVFGLILLFSPDLAKDLDERSGGGSPAEGPGVAVTETKRTTEATTETEGGSTSNKKSTRASNRPGGRRDGDGGNRKTRTQLSRRDQTTSTTTTTETTTETTPVSSDEGWVAGVFAVPAVAVLLRLAAIALLASLAALPFLWARRGNQKAVDPATASPSNPHAREAPEVASDVSATAPSSSPPPAPPPKPPPLPANPLVTRVEAEKAKARVMDGIPLLREIFEERGEPTIANTLPDMRVRVKLTDTIMKEQPLPVSVLAEDPALALGTFRAEVEQRLRRLARDAVAQSADSIDEILRGLTDEGLFEPQAADGLRNLLKMSESVSRGARVDPAMGAWVREEGVSLLLSLDLMLPS